MRNVIGRGPQQARRHRRRRVDTAGTLIEIVRAFEREGVTEIYACATHVGSGPWSSKIRD